jgi:hypothetical protein
MKFSMSHPVRLRYVAVIAALLATFAFAAFAKPASITLRQLVRQSSVIVLGRLKTEGSIVPKPGSGRIIFLASRVLKGDASYGGRDIQLCNSPPPMREYPDLSRLTGEVVMFLSAENDGCFEYSHTTTSVAGVRDGNVTTAAIADQPIYEPWDVFLQKITALVSEEARGVR